MARELYRVYVDETGDRGWGGRASPIFVVSAVIVQDGYEETLADTLSAINERLGKPQKTVLHWAENVKTHAQRKYAASELAKLEMTATSVVVMKQPLMGTGSGLRDPAQMYNYAVRRLLERISWYVDRRKGVAAVTFAHIRRFPYERYRSYIRLLRQSRTTIKWQAFTGEPKIDQPSRIRPLQVADLVAGAFGSALRPDDYGSYEPSYIMALAPRIHLPYATAALTSYGVNCTAPPENLRAYPWWDQFAAACAAAKGGAGPA